MKMELKHPDFDFTIFLEDGSSTVLCIESPTIMREMLSDLCAQVNGDAGLFVLSNDDSIIPMGENLEVIMDLLHPCIVTKKLSIRVSSLFKEYLVNEDNIGKTFSLIGELARYADEMISGFEYAVSYEDITSESLSKLLSVSIETYYDSHLEKLIECMNLHHDILGISSFVLLNASSVFSHEELSLFVKNSTSMSHNLIFMENHIAEKRLENTSYIIIDADGCELF